MDDVEPEPEPPQPAMANGVVIKSELPHQVQLEPRRWPPPPPPGPVVGFPPVLRLALAVTECHTWVGIGGRSGSGRPVRRPRRFSRDARLFLDLDADFSSGPNYLRRLIGRAMIKHSLRDEEEYRFLSPAQWDQAAAGGEALVEISVRFEFQYSEPHALLLQCYEYGGDLSGRRRTTGSGGGGDGRTASCAICFEEMARDEVTRLPGCTHGFHRRCIGAWFHKASTCPVCRRDQRQYIPEEYRRLRDVMTRDPDGCFPDYL